MRPRGRLVWLLLGLLAVLAARRSLDVVEVRGRSMAPTLLPGDRLLAVRLVRAAREGEVVLAADPRDPRRELVKRVARVDLSGIHLRGDNPAASTDARTFGAVSPAAIEWRVIGRYWPISHIGPLPSPSGALRRRRT
jgi:nickel-type superoxide dismutase maturation protease